MQSVPLICWDNIKLGTAISCPHIEKVLTGIELEDRVLGESRKERVSCSAILTFTGNNITAKGDLASRCLVARINVDRPDPENRAFKHPDPFGWTLDHRGEIIRDLYTILLGNPRLWQKKREAAKTRFKQWWHLVGSAVEFAAGLCNEKEPVDFRQLFLSSEANDEDAASLSAAKAAAKARHDRPGGSRDKQRQIREIWASGKYSTRGLCAEQEYEALDMSFSAARKALRKSPKPVRRIG